MMVEMTSRMKVEAAVVVPAEQAQTVLLLTGAAVELQNSLQLPEQQHTMQEEDTLEVLMYLQAPMVLEAEIM